MIVLNPARRHLVAVKIGHISATRACDCPTWSQLDRLHRDLVLAGFMQWAWTFYRVQLKVLARGSHVAICALLATRPGQGRGRKVMTELCIWANCAQVTLELTPSDHWGADVERLTIFYHSLGFVPNQEPEHPFRINETMIRYPEKDHGHIRGR